MIRPAPAGTFGPVSDNELGTFLRTRREAVTPAEVGLPDNGRRRTPGLRRAELATLAGVSVDYLTRLEQGRDRHPSAQVLAALAEALRLPGTERMLLVRTAKAAGGNVCAYAEAPAQSVRPTVRTLLDRLEPTPAYVVNRLSHVLAYTTGYARLTGPLGLLDIEPPNLLRFIFTDERARAAYPDWERVADARVADLKMELARTDPHVAALAEELTVTGGAAFTERWEGPPAVPGRTGVERLAHPDVGELRLAYETLEVAEGGDQRLIVYLPADDATSTALDRLAHERAAPIPRPPGEHPNGQHSHEHQLVAAAPAR